MSRISYVRKFSGLYMDHRTRVAPPPDLVTSHTHEAYELLYILSGDVTHVVEDRKYKLKKHDLVVIRPHAYHFIQVDSSQDYERRDILFSPEQLHIEHMELLPAWLDVIGCRDRPIIRGIFERMDYYNTVLEEQYAADMGALLLKELIYDLHLSADAAEDEVGVESVHPLVSRALNDIGEHLFSIRSVGEVARRLGVTESYLYRVFKQELKTSPMQYVTVKKLSSARSLILEGERPTQVYLRCGFRDYTTFYRAYVKHFGIAPSQVNSVQNSFLPAPADGEE